MTHVFPVHVTNWPPVDNRVLVWAILAGVAAVVAAIVGVVDMTITTVALVRKSKLSAWISPAADQGNPGERRVYRFGCSVTNRGNRGLAGFRVTFFLPAECYINQVLTNRPFVIGGPHEIDGKRWFAAEIECGSIYADDVVFVGNIEVVAMPGEYEVRWVVKSEDARSPKMGLSPALSLTLPVSTLDRENTPTAEEATLAAQKKPNINARGYVIGPDEHRRRGYQPPSNTEHLVVEVRNAGPGVVTDARVKALDGSMLWVQESIGPIGVNASAEGVYRVETYGGQRIGLPTRILVEYEGDGWVGGDVTLGMQGDPPTWRPISSTPVRPVQQTGSR